jgi:hypothetical protein
VIDFFDFNSAASGDAADGTGRTCSNHDNAQFSGIDFSQWWDSQPRADFNPADVGTTVTDALSLLPYDTTGSRWTSTYLTCDTVKYTATIPTSNLISNSTGDCHKVTRCAPPIRQG